MPVPAPLTAVPATSQGLTAPTRWPMSVMRNAPWHDPLWLGLSPAVVEWCWLTSSGLVADPDWRVASTPWMEANAWASHLVVPVARLCERPTLPVPGTPEDHPWSAATWTAQVQAHPMNTSYPGMLVLRHTTSGRIYWHVRWQDPRHAPRDDAAPASTTLSTPIELLWALRLAMVTEAAEADRVASDLLRLLVREPASQRAATDALTSPRAAPWWRALSPTGWAEVLDAPVAAVRAVALLTMASRSPVPASARRGLPPIERAPR